ncbi:MAG: hypothetical protein K1W19_08565 [Lachnospiraceae bacterium]
MISAEECGCMVCGTPTKYIEVCSEAHFCSDECVDKFYGQVSEFERIGTDFEERCNRISTAYQINKNHAGCWLSNFGNNYICHKHNGECKNNTECKEIFEKESTKRS